MNRNDLSLRSPKIHGLYAILPELTNTDELINKTQQVLVGGAKVIQYRNKSTNRQLQKHQAGLLLQLCKHHGIPLIINDYLDLTLEIDADGLHIGRDDFAIADARKFLGNDKILGASCYDDLNLAIHAESQGVDYVAFGSFFPSKTKSNTVPVSVDFIRNARQQINIPIVGIGGIQCHHVSTLIDSGCDAIAVCNDLFAIDQTKAKAAEFTQIFTTRI